MKMLTASSLAAVLAAATGPVLAQSEQPTARDAFYCDERKLGTWFYCNSEEAKRKARERAKQQQPAPSVPAVERMAAITRQLDELKALAVLEPTQENIVNYIRFQREQLDRASTFADVWGPAAQRPRDRSERFRGFRERLPFVRDEFADDGIRDPDRRALPVSRLVRERDNSCAPGGEPVVRERVPLDPQRVDNAFGDEPRGEDAARFGREPGDGAVEPAERGESGVARTSEFGGGRGVGAVEIDHREPVEETLQGHVV
jgi:hypothetical protein